MEFGSIPLYRNDAEISFFIFTWFSYGLYLQMVCMYVRMYALYTGTCLANTEPGLVHTPG